MKLLDETIALANNCDLAVETICESAGIKRRTYYSILNRDHDTGVNKVQALYDFLSNHAKPAEKKKTKRAA